MSYRIVMDYDKSRLRFSRNSMSTGNESKKLIVSHPEFPDGNYLPPDPLACRIREYIDSTDIFPGHRDSLKSEH